MSNLDQLTGAFFLPLRSVSRSEKTGTNKNEKIATILSRLAESPVYAYTISSNHVIKALVAQLDRASGYEPEGRGFDIPPSAPKKTERWPKKKSAEGAPLLREYGFNSSSRVRTFLSRDPFLVV